MHLRSACNGKHILPHKAFNLHLYMCSYECIHTNKLTYVYTYSKGCMVSNILRPSEQNYTKQNDTKQNDTKQNDTR